PAISPPSLHDALPISAVRLPSCCRKKRSACGLFGPFPLHRPCCASDHREEKRNRRRQIGSRAAHSCPPNSDNGERIRLLSAPPSPLSNSPRREAPPMP